MSEVRVTKDATHYQIRTDVWVTFQRHNEGLYASIDPLTPQEELICLLCKQIIKAQQGGKAKHESN